MSPVLCPDCRAERPPGSPSCPSCGLPLAGPAATELGRVDRELVDVAARLTGLDRERAQLLGRRAQLVTRRAELINALRAAARAVTRPPASAGGPFPTGPIPTGPIPTGPIGAARDAAALPSTARMVAQAGETSSQSIQTVLLLLGGLLLAVAAIAFTVFAWSRFGISGRALILAGLTVVMLGVPALLVKFRLPATGETIAAVGLVLVALDGYAAWRVGFLGVDDTLTAGVYSGVVATVLTLVAAGYPALVPLRLPRPIAVVAGQAALPLLASSTDTPAGSVAALMVALNLAVVWFAKRHRATPELVLASIGAGVAGLVATGQALWELVIGNLTDTIGAAVVLVVLGALGLVAAELINAAIARQFAACAASLAVAAGAFGIYQEGTDGYGVTAGAVLALLLAAVAVPLPAQWRAGALGGAAAVTTLAAAAPAFWTAAALAAPLTWLPRAWTTGSAWADARLVPAETFAPTPDITYAVAPVAAALAVLVWRLGGRTAAVYAVTGPAVAATLLVPVAVGAPLWVALLVEGAVALAAGAAAIAVRSRGLGTVLTVISVLLGAHAALWSLAHEGATLVTVGAAAVLWTALATARAAIPARTSVAWLGGGTAAAALLAVTGETAAVAVTLGTSRLGVALAIFVAALVAVGVAALLRDRIPGYGLAALVTVPVSASAGVLTGAVDTGRPDVALLATLAGTVVLVAAAVAQATQAPKARSEAGTALGAVGIIGLGAGVLALLPVVAQAVLGPVSWVSAVWRGAPDGSRTGLGADFGWDGTGVDAVTLVILGVGAAIVAGLDAAWRSREARRAALLAAAPAWALAALLVPLVFDAPWQVGLGTTVALALGGATVAALAQRWTAAIGAAFALVLGVTALSWSLAARPATVTVLAVTLAAGAAAGWIGRNTATQLTGTVAAALAALAEAGVVAAVADLPQVKIAYPVLGAAAVLAGMAAVLRVRRPDQAVALEGSAVAGALAALALASSDTWHSALVLTLGGLTVGLTALRPDRRPAAIVALVLELAASWLWLWTAGVTTPEAYTVPAALIALAAGLLALRRRRDLSSWPALAPGLAGGFLPSLVLVFSDGNTPWRSLLLGTAALGVTIAGAATRRQAPFALGSVTLALVALREIWPLLPWVAASVPAWVPLALGGALLVVLGATYEQRRRDLSRVRKVVARMN